MFFNAGRMGFRHFKVVVIPGPGDPGGGGTGCFGLTDRTKVVFGYDNFGVPDKPRFSYIYDCRSANECFSFTSQGSDSSDVCGGGGGVQGQPGNSFDVNPFDYCSCTGARARNLQCWKKKIYPDVVDCQQQPPETCVTNSDPDVPDSDYNICADFPVTQNNPTAEELCSFCNNDGVSGSNACGVAEVYASSCDCTARNADCFGFCSGQGCAHCKSANNLAWLVPSEDGAYSCDSNAASTYLLPDLITGYTGWSGSYNPSDADQKIQDFFNMENSSSGICATIENSELGVSAIDVTKLSLDGSITDTNQIQPQNMLNLSGHNCDSFCADGSSYRTFFSYLTFENGVTFCNIFMSPQISNSCAPATGTVPNFPGCTFCFPGITADQGTCFQQDDDYNATLGGNVGIVGRKRDCTAPYMLNLGCAHGLARHYAAFDDIPNNTSGQDGKASILNNEMRKWRRIDNSEIDSCGVNPCLTSNFYQFDGGGTPTGGFNGVDCYSYLGQGKMSDGKPFPKSVDDTERDPNGSDFRVSDYYENYYAYCDKEPTTANYSGGGTADLVAGVSSDRTSRVNESVKRVGRRSEQLFDLPLVSVGTARSFFAPWVDDMIHHIATPLVSGRKLGGKEGSFTNANSGKNGDVFSTTHVITNNLSILAPVHISHLAMGPYPAYSYYSWFYGPMFDVSETMTQQVRNDSGEPGMHGANHAAINTRFEGQWGPHIFGKFLTHPGFLGTPEDTMRNLINSSAGSTGFDSWGAIRLNRFSEMGGSIFKGGTLPKFTDTLSTGIEAFNNPNQNRKNEALTTAQIGDAEQSWPPRSAYESGSMNYIIPVAGATASAIPLDHNPHGITAHSALGWCSSINRQNSSWLNPRFTVASNWLWPGGKEEYDTTDHRAMFYLATVDTGEFSKNEMTTNKTLFNRKVSTPTNYTGLPDGATYAGALHQSRGPGMGQMGKQDAYHAASLDYRGRIRELSMCSTYRYARAGGQFDDLTQAIVWPVTFDEFGFGDGDIGDRSGSDDETRVSPFAPLNRIFNYHTERGVEAQGFFGLGGSTGQRSYDPNQGGSLLGLECPDGPGIPGNIDEGEPGIGVNCPSCVGTSCLCELCACWCGLLQPCKDAYTIDGVPVRDSDMAQLCSCCNGIGGQNPVQCGGGDKLSCTDCAACVGEFGCTFCNGEGGEELPECEGICWDRNELGGDISFLHNGFQFPTTYNAYWREPFWRVNSTGTWKKRFTTGDEEIVDVLAYPSMEMDMAVNRENNSANKQHGCSVRRFGMFTNVKKPNSPNQRFQGMDRYRLQQVLPTNPSDTSEFSGIDPETTIMPSPSLLSYYPLPIIGGWGYGGPPTTVTDYNSLLPYRGVGNGRGYLYGPYGRDIIWADPLTYDQRSFKNSDGTAVTGPVKSDRKTSSPISQFHSQRLFANGSNTTPLDSIEAFGGDIIGNTASDIWQTATNCEDDLWKTVRASHCLLDISDVGITKIKSSFVGCTAFYHSSAFKSNANDAESVYQFNGNGWWYRTHEQLRLGINEEGYTSGVGPSGYIRHQNGYFPGYVNGVGTDGDRMYGPNADPIGGNINSKLEGTTFDSGHGFVQDIVKEVEVTNTSISQFTGISKNTQVNNGWTACTLKNAVAGHQRQATDTHFPEISSGYYPVSTSGGIDILDDTKMFDAVFALDSGQTGGITSGGYFTLVNQSGETLQIRVTGGSSSQAPSSNSDTVNINIEPYKDSLNTFGETFDLLCMTDADMNKPFLGDCSRINDHSAGGYRVWPPDFVVKDVVGWTEHNAQG